MITGRVWWFVALLSGFTLLAAAVVGVVAGSPWVVLLAMLGLAGLGVAAYGRRRRWGSASR